MIALLFWAFIIWLAAGGGPTYARDAKRRFGSEVKGRAARDGKSSVSWWLLRFFEGIGYAFSAAWKGWGNHTRYAKRKVAEYQQKREAKAPEEPAAATPEPDTEPKREVPEPYRIVKVTSKSGEEIPQPNIQVPDVGVLGRVLDQIDTDPDKRWVVTYPDGTPDLAYQQRPPQPPNGGGTPPPAEPDDQADRTVVPIRPEPATAQTNEGNTVITGDATGYEQILAGYESNIELLEQLDAGYEAQIAMLRNLNADDDTISDVATMREANDNQLTAARETRDNWVSRHGAVYEAKASTGAEGDQALYA